MGTTKPVSQVDIGEESQLTVFATFCIPSEVEAGFSASSAEVVVNTSLAAMQLTRILSGAKSKASVLLRPTIAFATMAESGRSAKEEVGPNSTILTMLPRVLD